MALDHGVLNVPLNRRGNTLFGLTRSQFEKQQLAERKEAQRRYVALCAEASGLVDMVSDARMAELGKPHGMTARRCRKQWHSIVKGAPGSVIGCMRRELATNLLALVEVQAVES